MFKKSKIRTIVALTLAISLVGIPSAHLTLAQTDNQNTDEAEREAGERNGIIDFLSPQIQFEADEEEAELMQSGEAQAAGAQTIDANAAVTATVLADVLNVRAGPSTAHAILTTLPQNTRVNVQGRDAMNTWLLIDIPDGEQGWVSRAFVDYMDLIPIVEQPPLAPPAQEAPVPDAHIPPTIVTLDPTVNVNVRAGPSTNHAVLQRVTSGTHMDILGQNATGDWLQIRFSDGSEGWVARSLTNFVGTAPIIETPPTAQPPLAPPAAPPVTDPAAPATIVTIDPNVSVNVRSGPSTNHAVLQRVTPGTQMTIQGQNAAGDWLHVRFSDGSQGWVARFLTNFTGTVPVMETPPIGQPPLAPPAAEPPAAPPVETGPMTLPYQPDPLTDPAPMVNDALSANWRTLPVGETHWYYFDHPGDQLPRQIWMDSDPNEGAGFRVFSQSDAEAIMAGANPDDFDAIGRGTTNDVEPGHLFWRGEFAESGRFYVMVEHGFGEDVPYTIFSAGPTFR